MLNRRLLNRGSQQVYGIDQQNYAEVQFAEITVTNTNTSINTTIDAVDTNNTLIFGTQELNDSVVTFSNLACTWQLTSSTNISTVRNGTTGSANQVNLSIVSFKPGAIKSLQYDAISLGAATTSATSTINSIDVNKSFIIPCGAKHTSGTAAASGALPPVGASFDNSTTLRIEKSSAATIMVIQYLFLIVEYN